MRALILCLPLLACAPPDILAIPDGPAPNLATCGGNTLTGFIGQPATTLPATGPWGVMRVIQPGMGVTMDYSASRLNVTVDGKGKILTLTCG